MEKHHAVVTRFADDGDEPLARGSLSHDEINPLFGGRDALSGEQVNVGTSYIPSVEGTQGAIVNRSYFTNYGS